MKAPKRIAGVFCCGCNMAPSGTKDICQSRKPGAEHAVQLFCSRSICPSQSYKASMISLFERERVSSVFRLVCKNSLVEQRRCV
jgi:hypothetical protein